MKEEPMKDLRGTRFRIKGLLLIGAKSKGSRVVTFGDLIDNDSIADSTAGCPWTSPSCVRGEFASDDDVEHGLRHCEFLFRPLLELELNGDAAGLPLGCNRNAALLLVTFDMLAG
jgi:hypothetical protein